MSAVSGDKKLVDLKSSLTYLSTTVNAFDRNNKDYITLIESDVILNEQFDDKVNFTIDFFLFYKEQKNTANST